jgi:hypothetical protein
MSQTCSIGGGLEAPVGAFRSSLSGDVAGEDGSDRLDPPSEPTESRAWPVLLALSAGGRASAGLPAGRLAALAAAAEPSLACGAVAGALSPPAERNASAANASRTVAEAEIDLARGGRIFAPAIVETARTAASKATVRRDPSLLGSRRRDAEAATGSGSTPWAVSCGADGAWAGEKNDAKSILGGARRAPQLKQ